MQRSRKMQTNNQEKKQQNTNKINIMKTNS